VAGTFSALAGGGEYAFVTAPAEPLVLTYDGIPDDRHFGPTRRSGGRERWYPRGTEMRNERQLSLVAADELAEAAARLGVPDVRPEWIGANIVISGLPRFSMLPAGTRLAFAGGATIAIDGQNAPCRSAGASIAAHYRDKPEIEFAFAKVARRLRGLVGWVERPGQIAPGEAVVARIPEQWIYSAGENP
jgi:hypothetical protein